MKYLLIAILVLAVLASAKPKRKGKMGGPKGKFKKEFMKECLGKSENQDDFFPKPGEFLGCFKPLDMTDDQKKTAQICHDKVMSSGGPDDLDDVLADISSLTTCLIEDFDLATDGELDLEKITAHIELLEEPADSGLKAALLDITTDCFNDLPSDANNATEQMLALMECKLNEMFDYCVTNDQPTGKLAVIVSLMTLPEDSVCEPVEVIDTVRPVIEQCMKDLEIDPCKRRGPKRGGGGGGGKKKGPGGKRNGRPRSREERQAKKEEMKEMMCEEMKKRMTEKKGMIKKMLYCVGSELGFLNNETGIDFDKYKTVIEGFPGWDDTQASTDALSEILDSVDDCAANAVFNDVVTPTEIAILPKLEDLEPLAVQAIRFAQCFMPAYADTCGMKNQLSLFLFPPLHKIYPEDVKEDIGITEDLFKCKRGRKASGESSESEEDSQEE